MRCFEVVSEVAIPSHEEVPSLSLIDHGARHPAPDVGRCSSTFLPVQVSPSNRVPVEQALELLDAWLKWARRCRLQPFVKLAKTITKQRPGIEAAALRNGLSNARTEQVNTQIRLITRRGFGYHSRWAVIALAMLSLGGLCPPLPGR